MKLKSKEANIGINWALPKLTKFVSTILFLTTLLVPILKTQASTDSNYDPAKIKYARDKPKSSSDNSVANSKLSSSPSLKQAEVPNPATKPAIPQEEAPPVLPPNKLTVEKSGCYYVSQVSHDGAGGKLYLVGKNQDGSDKLISDNYNNLTTKSKFILLGSFLSGQDLVLKITPFYSQSPKTILSTDSSRVKQVDLGNNTYSLAFEDWLDYDFNDIILRIEKGDCGGEGLPTTPQIPPRSWPICQPKMSADCQPKMPEVKNDITKNNPPVKLPDNSTVSPVNNPTTNPVSNPTTNPASPITPHTPITPSASKATLPLVVNAPAAVQTKPVSAASSQTLASPAASATLAPTVSPASSASLLSSSVSDATIGPNYTYNCATILYDRWCGEYFDNNPYTGVLTYAETFQTSRDFLDVDWGSSSPNPPGNVLGQFTPVDNFTAKFVKNQYFDGGYYKFYSFYDDGMKLAIDGNVVMDYWNASSGSSEIRIDVAAGWHTLEVYYKEKTGDAKIVVKWELACRDRNNWSDWCAEFYPNQYQREIPVKPVVKGGDFWNENWGSGRVNSNLNNYGFNSFSGQYVDSDTGIKNLPTDYFSGYFTKMQYFEAGTYTFTGAADDGLEVSIDSQRLITQGSCCGPSKVIRKMETSGWYFMQVKQVELTLDANISFSWERLESILPDGRITSPSVNYQTVTGSSFKVEAKAWDLGTPQSLVDYVDFYAWYDNKLVFLGKEYNDNIDELYSATIDLNAVSSSQNIEFSINITDRAGNTKLGGWGSVWVNYKKYNSDITASFSVTSPSSVPSCSQGSQCYSNFILLYGNRYSYDNNKTVWIVTHGRGDNTDGWVKDIGNQIHSSYPNDIVLLLDWRNGAGDTSNPPYKSGKFTGPIAKAAKQKLNDWGFSNQYKLNIIGHSLGSLLSAKLSEEMGRAKTLTLLSPPGNAGFGYYDVNPNEKLSSFQGKAQFSRAIVMSGELADDQTLAKTANEKILVDSPGITIDTNGTKHVANTRLFQQLIGSRKLYNNYLDLNNLSSNNFPLNSSFNARLVTSGNIDTNYLQVNYADKLVNYGSTGGENIPTITYGILEDFGNSGDDLFQFDAVERNQLNTIKDFSGNDKIQLSNYYAGAPYYIQSENSYPVIYQRNGGINYRVGRVEGVDSGKITNQAIQDAKDGKPSAITLK